MTTTRAGVVLRHIRGLAARPAGAADRHLLERFTAGRDEAAFAELMRRHGPLVLGVCRRLLRDPNDADDAFQATFLVLARKAASISNRESVGGWLYQVAHNTAVKTRLSAAARRRRERRAGARPPADVLDEVTGRELLAVLDEELTRLPRRLRAPLVLCHLEGRTRDEAARELGWSLGTLKRRLDEGRGILRARLERRGLALPAALLALGAAATVPAALAAAVRAAVMGAAVPARVAGLTEAALRAAAPGWFKIVAGVLLAAGLVAAGAGLFADRTPAAGAGADEKAAAEPKDQPAPAVDDKKQTAVSGRLLDADGKPVDGAEVVVLGRPKERPFALDSGWLQSEVLARAKADADGQFRLTLTDAVRAKYQEVYALAGKSGHGPVLERLVPETEPVLRLAREKVLRGRLLDLQGLPAAGVEVQVTYFQTKGGGIGGGIDPKDFSPWPAAVKTDKDGRFVIRGLNPDLEGYLLIEGDEFGPDGVGITTGPQEVKLTLAPAHVLEGVVTAEDTGKPIPRAEVVLNGSGAYAQTDEQGRYRLKSRPLASCEVFVTAPEGLPYLRLQTTFAWPKGAVRHEKNLALERGVLVRGKVTDAASGQPVADAIVHDGAHVWTRYARTGADGTFRIAVGAGRGHLLVKGPNNDFIGVEITAGEVAGGKRSGKPYHPDAVIALDTKVGAEAVEVSAKLRRGVTLRGRLVGPDGKPMAEGVLCCWNQLRPEVAEWYRAAVAVRDGQFELRGCDPERTYPVYFLDAKNKLGASVTLSAKEAGDRPPTVRLERCGSATVRFVDREGKPRAGYRPFVDLVARPGDKDVEPVRDFISYTDPLHYGGLGPAADAEGRCTFPVLIPGATYQILGNDLSKEFTVKSGETRNLGDVVVPFP
jgi:RNA polymerase sigma factor (sigma-70 family)